jgi:hypothetical protein
MSVFRTLHGQWQVDAMKCMTPTHGAKVFLSIPMMSALFSVGHAADGLDLDALKKSTGAGFLPRERILGTHADGGVNEEGFLIPLRAMENPRHPTVNAYYSVTSKGNGSIQIGDTHIRIYDLHDDGHLFEGGLLNEKLVDLDGDGIPELIFSGMDDETDKQDDVVKRTPVLSIWKLKPDGSGLIELVHDDLVYSWVDKQ